MLYSFAIEPKWATHFFPRKAFNIVDQLALPNREKVPVGSLPTFLSDFSLVGVQEEEPVEYGANRRGKPCGHVFSKGEGVYHCRSILFFSNLVCLKTDILLVPFFQ